MFAITFVVAAFTASALLATGACGPTVRTKAGGADSPNFIESLVTTMAVGRDQGYLAKPWVNARTIEIDTTSVGILEFDVDDDGEDALYEHGRSQIAAFLGKWDFEATRLDSELFFRRRDRRLTNFTAVRVFS